MNLTSNVFEKVEDFLAGKEEKTSLEPVKLEKQERNDEAYATHARETATGISSGASYLLINNGFSALKDAEGGVGEIGSRGLEWTKEVLYEDVKSVGEVSVDELAWATSDNVIHASASYGIAGAACMAVERATEDHDPKKTALGGMAAVAGFTLFKEGYWQGGNDLQLSMDSLDTQGDIIMNTVGGLASIYRHHKRVTEESDGETEGRIYELARRAGRATKTYEEAASSFIDDLFSQESENNGTPIPDGGTALAGYGGAKSMKPQSVEMGSCDSFSRDAPFQQPVTVKDEKYKDQEESRESRDDTTVVDDPQKETLSKSPSDIYGDQQDITIEESTSNSTGEFEFDIEIKEKEENYDSGESYDSQPDITIEKDYQGDTGEFEFDQELKPATE